MNKKIVLITALWASSTAFAAGIFETWCGTDDGEQVETGLGNETATNGYWYGYLDNDRGGESSIEWPVRTCPVLDCIEHFLEDVIEFRDGVSGTAHLDQGTMTTKPFIGVGFNVVGKTSSTNDTPAAGDASTWGGLCVTYASNVDLQLELGLGEAIDSTISYANPAVTLPAAWPDILSPKRKYGNKVIVSWSDFKQPSWYDGSVKIDGETAAKQLVAIHFKLQAESGDYNFNICAVGPKDGTCPEECGISREKQKLWITRDTKETATAKAILKGHILGFTGVSNATAVVMNSLGQVVAKGAIEGTASTLNLAHLKAGVYLVRVIGKSVNFTNRITVK